MQNEFAVDFPEAQDGRSQEVIRVPQWAELGHRHEVVQITPSEAALSPHRPEVGRATWYQATESRRLCQRRASPLGCSAAESGSTRSGFSSNS